jgi:hypothetical protein
MESSDDLVRRCYRESLQKGLVFAKHGYSHGAEGRASFISIKALRELGD